jgi:hypothetical protein
MYPEWNRQAFWSWADHSLRDRSGIRIVGATGAFDACEGSDRPSGSRSGQVDPNQSDQMLIACPRMPQAASNAETRLAESTAKKRGKTIFKL